MAADASGINMVCMSKTHRQHHACRMLDVVWVVWCLAQTLTYRDPCAKKKANSETATDCLHGRPLSNTNRIGAKQKAHKRVGL